MKKKFRNNNFKLQKVVSSLFFIFSTIAVGQTCAIQVTNEAKFNPVHHETTTESAHVYIENFRKWVTHMNINMTFESLAAEIDTIHLCILKNEADVTMEENSCNKYLTAVNIKLGMNGATRKLEYFYEPIVLCYSLSVQTTASALTCTLDGYYPIMSGKNYSYSATGFHTVDPTYVENSVSTYTSQIKIVHFEGDVNNNFRVATSGTDTLGDTKSIIYTFKEIQKTIRDNSNCKHLRIWNQITTLNVQYGGANINLRKHSLILSGDQSDGMKSKGFAKFISSSFPGEELPGTMRGSKYKNLAHLCPPNCSLLYFYVNCTN